MNRNGLKIGEFSRLCRVTVRALRHYEKIRLLVPEIIDYSTGYRYYSVGQMQKALTIVKLKGLGFSLEEIRAMYESGTLRPPIDMLEEKISRCKEQLRLLTECRDRLSAMITFQKKLNEMENIYIDSLPAIIVASHRAVIQSYDELGKLCYMTIGPEMSRLGCECPEPGYCYTIEHGGYKQENIDIEYCEKVTALGKDSDIIKFKQIPDVAEAVCMKVYGPYDRLSENLRKVLEWIEANEYTIAASPRYSYVDGIWNQEDPEKWLTVIQVPVTR
ncbi:MAG: MerR family transcriptional regulator [Bacteroidales bacterium]|nr:MerR family transcriptional regulator [Bacteroidales bacterium]